MQSLTQDKKICVIKISPTRADGEIGENFLLAKISAYTVEITHNVDTFYTGILPTSSEQCGPQNLNTERIDAYDPKQT